jgi:lipid-A-disaccharide synthase
MKSANDKVLRFFIVAGEASGDLHGAQLVHAIKKSNPDAVFRGLGGPLLQKEGVALIEHIAKLSYVGFTEVVKHLPFFRKLMKGTVESIKQFQPDRVILIDYPGFNLRLARRLSEANIPVTYFILPQVWAWKEKRVNVIRQFIDQALCILPFEKEWFNNRGVRAEYVGHPFAEPIVHKYDKSTLYTKHGFAEHDVILGLFPGSRQQEVDRHWPVFTETVARIKDQVPELKVIAGKAEHVNFPDSDSSISVEEDNPRSVLAYGSAAIVASGTATLEAAVLGIPIIVCYKLSNLTWWLVRQMSTIEHVSLVNLIADELVVPEFLQANMHPAKMAESLLPLLHDSKQRAAMLAGYVNIRSKLGEPGVYRRAAKSILRRHS